MYFHMEDLFYFFYVNKHLNCMFMWKISLKSPVRLHCCNSESFTKTIFCPQCFP